MAKPGIQIVIPGLGDRTVRTIVSDFTGTLAFGGRMSGEVRARLLRLAEDVDLHVITADSFGTAAAELSGIVVPYFLRTDRHDVEKREYVSRFALAEVASLGNGNNDRLMLRAVKEGQGLAVAVDNGEGCAVDALINAHLLIVGAGSALDLLLEPRRCRATLRF